MSDEEPPVPEEILTSAKEQLDEGDISLADNEEILHALSELTPVYENDRTYSALGSYDRGPIRRLNLVVDRLNRRTDAYAFRMVDIRGEWDNTIQKFCLIADIVTDLVGVAEKDPSDFLVEQGLLVGTVEYFSKSHVLKREYDDEEHPFGWMQDGVFELFDREGRLYRWKTEDELVSVTETSRSARIDIQSPNRRRHTSISPDADSAVQPSLLETRHHLGVPVGVLDWLTERTEHLHDGH